VWYEPKRGWEKAWLSITEKPLSEAITHWMPLPELPKAELWSFKAYYYYSPNANWYIIKNRDGVEISGEQICAALNSTPRELLAFAGMECEYGCDERGPFTYALTRNEADSSTIGYKIIDRKGIVWASDVCNMLNTCCCKCGCDEADSGETKSGKV
jgi:hypothetical protein